jgi:hypothetical protein
MWGSADMSALTYYILFWTLSILIVAALIALVWKWTGPRRMRRAVHDAIKDIERRD